jgi:hypothetical protein
LNEYNKHNRIFFLIEYRYIFRSLGNKADDANRMSRMRIEAKFKNNDGSGPSQEVVQEGIRLFLARQAAHLIRVKVVLSSDSLPAGTQSSVMFRVDFITGGSLILEEHAESPALALRQGLFKLRKALEVELRRRWIFQEPGVLGKPIRNLLRKIWHPKLKSENLRLQC